MNDEQEADRPMPPAAPTPEPPGNQHEGGTLADGTREPGPQPPRTVRLAAYLLLVNAAVALLSVLVTLATPIADYRATVAAAYPVYTAEQVAKLAGDLRKFHLVVAGVLLLANLALSLGLRRGLNWVRVATLLLTGMALVVTVSGGSGQAGALAAAVTLLGVAVDVAILALLATRSARAFFPRARPGREPRTF